MMLALTSCDDRSSTGSMPPVAIHYAPAENLEPYDVALIDRARRTIDMAAYLLSGKPVMEALERAARRSVIIRIQTDRGQLASLARSRGVKNDRT